jgi:protein-disulfide isomerase
MKRFWIIVAALILVSANLALAQSPRRGTPRKASSTRPASSQPAAPKPSDAATPPAPTAASDSVSPTLAIVNETTVTAADIEANVTAAVNNNPDPYFHAFYQDREKAIREARQRAFDARVQSMLIAAEARKRSLTTDDYLNREVNARIPMPTDAEVRAVYEANRAQLGNDLEAVRPNIVNYLRAERAEQTRGELVNRLKMTNTLMKNADVNAANLAPGTVLASVNGEPLRIEVINERMKAYVHKMESQIFAAQKRALDQRVNDLLVIAEANKRKIGAEEIIRAEVTEKLKPPTEAEISKFYDENKARINGDLASTRTTIATYLQEQQQAELEKALADRLRSGAKVQMLLKEPVPPVFNVGTGKGVARGDVNSAVKIVEFTDFQCSACGGMYPVIEDVLKSYGNRVYFEVRNFPLTLIHPNALQAAHAAAAANAQGKFWPYIDFLFKNQNALDIESLKKYATQAGLDRKQFDADLESAKFDANIRRDVEDAEVFGVEGTPTIFINGVVLTDLSADGLRDAIEKGFARAGKP